MPTKRSHSGPRPSEFKVTDHKRPYDEFLRIECVTASFKAYGDNDRFIDPGHATEVMVRGDSVAAILYDPGERAVILVEQFRLPTSSLFRRRWIDREPLEPATSERPHIGGWIVETVAGSLRNKAEAPAECLRREVLEEAGYRVTDLRKITDFFSSPGGTSEMIHLYFAEVTETSSELGAGRGVGDEDIDVLHVPVEEFFDGLERGEYRDPKIIIGGYWLRDHLARTPLRRKSESVTIDYKLKDSNVVFGIKTGNIVDVEGIDAWVNPENTNMQMDRFFGRSISAAIRWAGAEKEKSDGGVKMRVKRDSIAEELRRELGDRYNVGLGDVVKTGPGALSANGVKGIFHVAVAEGFVEEGLKTSIPTLTKALEDVMQLVAYENRWRAYYRSLLVPMMGTGTSGRPVREVAPALVKTAIDFVRANPSCGLTKIYFNAYSIDDRSHLEKALQDAVERGLLTPPAESSPTASVKP